MAGKWTRERVIEAIQARAGQKSRVVTTRHDQGLYFAGRRLFGSWQDALRAAGVEPCQRKWSPQDVIDAILAWQRAGRLGGISSRDRALYAAAYRHFGDWPKALAAAGLPSPPKRCWSKELVIEAIQARSRQGLPMRGIQRDDSPLLRAAQSYWGSWHAALLAAGINVPTQQWDRHRIVAALKALRREGVPLRCSHMPRSLYEAASRCFGDWNKALAALGLPPTVRPRQQWTRQRVIDAIRRQRDEGQPLRSSVHKALALAAIRHFGTWSGALRAAGIEPDPHRQKWSRQRVLDQLHALQRQGRFDESTWIEDRKLAAAGIRYFGTWRAALLAAGILAPDEQRRCRSKWTCGRIIEAIQDRYVRGLPMIASGDTKLYSAAMTHFGSWRAALAAAGLDVGDRPPPRRRWTRQRVIDEVKRLYASGMELVNVATTDSSLACAAYRYFGSWNNALAAAGLIPIRPIQPRRRQRWSKERIVRGIRALRRRSVPLNAKSPGVRRLVDAAYRHFGSWREALACAEIAPTEE